MTTPPVHRPRPRTVCILLVRVGHQAAVVPAIRDSIIVVVVITGIALPVIVRVLLGTVRHCRTVVPRVLVSVPIPTVGRWDRDNEVLRKVILRGYPATHPPHVAFLLVLVAVTRISHEVMVHVHLDGVRTEGLKSLPPTPSPTANDPVTQ
jgi:hypothetical protein